MLTMNKMPTAEVILVQMIDGSCIEIRGIDLLLMSVQVPPERGPATVRMEAIAYSVDHIISDLRRRDEKSNQG